MDVGYPPRYLAQFLAMDQVHDIAHIQNQTFGRQGTELRTTGEDDADSTVTPLFATPSSVSLVDSHATTDYSASTTSLVSLATTMSSDQALDVALVLDGANLNNSVSSNASTIKSTSTVYHTVRNKSTYASYATTGSIARRPPLSNILPDGAFQRPNVQNRISYPISQPTSSTPYSTLPRSFLRRYPAPPLHPVSEEEWRRQRVSCPENALHPDLDIMSPSDVSNSNTTQNFTMASIDLDQSSMMSSVATQGGSTGFNTTVNASSKTSPFLEDKSILSSDSLRLRNEPFVHSVAQDKILPCASFDTDNRQRSDTVYYSAPESPLASPAYVLSPCQSVSQNNVFTTESSHELSLDYVDQTPKPPSSQLPVSTLEQEDDRLRKRHMAAMEILHTERSYLDGLCYLHETFMEPLEARLKAESNLPAILSSMEIKTIFGCLLEVMTLSSTLLSWFVARLQPDDNHELDYYPWDPATGLLGDILKDVAPYLKAYSRYVQHYARAVEQVRQCRSSNPTFVQFLKVILFLLDFEDVTRKYRFDKPNIDLIWKRICYFLSNVFHVIDYLSLNF